MTANNTPWSEEKTKQLLSLHSERLSLAEISRRLGLTKNAVIGKLHRLRLTNTRPLPYEEAAERLLALIADGISPDEIARHVGVKKKSVVKRLRRLGIDGSADKPAPSLDERLSWDQVIRTGCRYVYGEPGGSVRWHWCGEPTLGEKPWCMMHAALCLRPNVEGEG